ncbi:MAG: helix-turn-helix domain-containing protein [Erysipelotrichaceae bacterium]
MKIYTRHTGIDFVQEVHFRDTSMVSMAKCETQCGIYEKAIAEVLKGLRTDLGLNQDEFAKLCGINPTAYCRMENCRRGLYFRQLFKICFFMQLNVSTVLQEVERLVAAWEKLEKE